MLVGILNRMNVFQQAATINNKGVLLLQAENVTGAIHAFQRAIIIVKDGAQPDSFMAQAREPPTSTAVACLPVCVRQCRLKLPGLQNGHFFVYDRPFLVATNLRPSTQEDYDAFIFLFLK